MGTNIQSISSMIKASRDKGAFTPFFIDQINSTTGALTTCGYVSCQRFTRTITIPSLGSGVTGIVFPVFQCATDDASHPLAAIEYSLGTLTVSGNSFADGVAMPSKTVRGVSSQTSSQLACLVATVAITATTPTVTITYTNQDGVTGKTCTMVLPTSVTINTVFLMNPHLASGDTGIRDVTNISISTGTAGTFKVFGLLKIGECIAIGSNPVPVEALCLTEPLWPAVAGDVIAFYRMVAVVAGSIAVMLVGIPDN